MRWLQVGLFSACALFSVAQAQNIVYDNTTVSLNNNHPLLPEWLDESDEGGDEIWLAGPERVATEFTVLMTYRGTDTGTVDFRLRFREFDELNSAPGAVIYDGGLVEDVQVVGGISAVTFAIPNVTVPDHLVWTVQLYDRQGFVGEYGQSYYNPASIGFSDDWMWLTGDGVAWTPYSWGGDPYANFGARLTAVPEPATLGALALGLLFLRRRKR